MSSELIRSHLRKPSVIAHRGASAHAPENSRASFIKALELGADFFELDAQMTRDGALAVFHDRDVSRFAVKHSKLVDLTMADMRSLDIGSWFSPEYASERVITLEEAFHIAGDSIGVYVELKSAVDETPRIPDLLEVILDSKSLSHWDWKYLLDAAYRISADSVVLARRAIDLVRSHMNHTRIVVQAFSPIIAVIFVHEAPDIRFEFLGMDLPDPPNIWRDFVLFGERIGVAGFNVNKESLDEQRLGYFHGLGCSSAVWVVDEPGDMVKFANMGVEGIISNKPDLCLATLDRMDLFSP